MSDLDLDAQAAMAKAMHEADCGCTEFKTGGCHWSDEYYDRLAAAAWSAVRPELERLRANQLPDGGEWSEEFMHHDRAETLAGWSVRSHSCNDGCGMRRVWRSSVQPPVSESKPSDNPAESTSDQTAAKTA